MQQMVSCCHGSILKKYLSNNQLAGTAGKRAAAEVQLGIVTSVAVAVQFLVGASNGIPKSNNHRW